MPDISIREYIRWIPEDASEPTSTIVLTSPGKRFVDVRLLHAEKGPEAEEDSQHLLPLDRLDWAIAGTSSYSEPRQDGQGKTFTHARWEHWIDSRTRNADGAADEGDNYAQPDGSTLEKGRMVNPATGLVTDYEELWSSPEIEAAPSGPGMEGTIGDPAVRCVVLQLRDDSCAQRGVVVLLGQYCQGILREGDDLTIERWQWVSSAGEWKKHFKIGNGVLACSAAIQHAHELEKDTDVLLGLQAWTVIELSEH